MKCMRKLTQLRQTTMTGTFHVYISIARGVTLVVRTNVPKRFTVYRWLEAYEGNAVIALRVLLL